MDDEDFTIPCVIDTIPYSPAGHQLPTQANKNVWIVAINVEEYIIYQGALDELKIHQTPCVKSKVKISLYRSKSYHRIDLENICPRFDQFRPMVSNIEVRLP